MVLPVKLLDLRQKDVPLGCTLRWDFYKVENITDFLFSDDALAAGYYGLYGTYLNSEEYFIPSNSRMYLFRRIGSPITDDDINGYFFGAPTDTVPEEIWIITPDIYSVLPRKRFDRERISHDCTVYYALIIRDMDTGLISAKITNNIVIT